MPYKDPAKQRAWRVANPDRVEASRQRWLITHPGYYESWYEKNKDKVYANVARWNVAHPERRRVVVVAKSEVRNAIRRGVLIRPAACEECGAVRRIEAAHYDYSKPLDVRWLCRPCHVRWDQAIPKTVEV